MSSITNRVRRLVASLFAVPRVPTDPETMSLHDWADMPVHHPLS